MGQFETLCFEKKHQTELLTNGKIMNIDFVASAIKEGLNAVATANQNSKEVLLILPQQSFHFFRTEVPVDIAPTALDAFIKDKARATLNIDISECLSDYFIEENGGKKQVSFYAINKETLEKFYEVFNLLEIKVSSILPETLSYFKLFKKTLRKDKTENIFYATYTGDYIKGYLFDSYGLAAPDVWESEVGGKKTIEALVKDKAEELEKDNKKLNRLILSGEGSESIRQDTFTKEVGVWTNPLKRIIPNFYEDYLKMFISSATKPFPILTYDACFGAFIFSYEHKNFSFLKNGSKIKSIKSSSSSSKGFPTKEFFIFLISFALSFLVFIGISKFPPQSISIPKTLSFMGPSATPIPSPTPNQPSPTPTPAIKKDELKLKVLNGSGTAGKATVVKNILQKQGYGEILTDNADNFNYTSTEIQVKKGGEGIADMLKEDLKANTTKFKVTTLGEKEAADAVVIFGTDFK